MNMLRDTDDAIVSIAAALWLFLACGIQEADR